MRIHRSVILVFGNEHEKGLEDAVISPMAIEGFCDRIEMCEDCFSKAALAIDYIADFHPFFEGNKRTAFELAVALLKKGGYDKIHFSDIFSESVFICDKGKLF